MNKYLIPNLVKACRVLRQLAHASDGLTAVDIEQQVDLPRSTAFRILKTLCFEGMAVKKGSRFYPGNALWEVGLRALEKVQIRELAVPILQSLATRTGETAHLGVLAGQHSLILEVCDSSNPIRVASRPGALADLHCSSTGKVLLANMLEEDRNEILDELSLNSRTEHTITTREALERELECVRQQGYGMDDEEYYQSVRCLAAPVYDAAGDVVAAIGITAVTTRFTKDKIDEMAAATQQAAEELSTALGAVR